MKALNFSEELKQWSKENGIKWQFLAEKLGMNRQKVSRLINNQQKPSLDDLVKIQNATGIHFLN